ncbi:MAG: LPS export ABC transporter permease LptF [Geminicoccaceae bacterium]|nr:LPS export ABC transporter permease LptF [Geminicoccaceae bacterium]
MPTSSTLTRYLLAQVLRPATTTIVAALLVLLAERALSVVNIVLGWRGSVVMIFEMLSYLVPYYLGFALPVALFLGIFFAFNRLGTDSEVDAMRASGVGLAGMVRPVLGLALVVALLHLALVSHLQPYSRYAYRAAVYAVTSASFQSLIQPGRFVTLGDTTYRVERLSADRRSFEGLFLYSERGDGGTVVLTAARGRIEPGPAGGALLLRLEDGVQQLARGGGEGGGVPALTLRFGELTTDLSGQEPKPFRPRGENERELTLPELWAMRGTSRGEIEAPEIEAELHARIVRTLAVPVLPFLALPLALPRRRARRSYGFVIGIVLLVGFNQILKSGETLVDDGRIGAWLGLWLPFAAFSALACILFVRAATTVPNPGGRTALDALTERLTALVLRRTGGEGTA